MKTFFKICIVLLMVVLISGLYYGVVTALTPNAVQLDVRVSGEFEPRQRQGDHGGGSSFPIDSVKNLLIISAVGVGYLNVSNWIKRKDQLAVRAK